jgi:3-deoxy-7-phosphoheptulonate synthase
MSKENKVFNLNIAKIDPLPTSASLRQEIPISDKSVDLVYNSREEIKKIIKREDPRLLAIVGPCSIHDTNLALDYAKRLAKLREEVKDQIYIVMRVYFEKPRTVMGWKGLINDPHLDGTFDIQTGLRKARKLLADITELGVPCATEMLDPVVPQYLADYITWAAIGARTTESQTHRQMASGLSMPVGFKNGTTGDLLVAINAIESAGHKHCFLGIHQYEGQISVFHTKGNHYCHLVLRGGSNGPNYTKEFVQLAEAELESARIDTGIMIDCNHANSGKDPYKQPGILENIVQQKLNGNKSIMGFMVESNIEGGSQAIPEDLSQLKYGVSVTDKCIDFENTAKMFKSAAEQLRQ